MRGGEGGGEETKVYFRSISQEEIHASNEAIRGYNHDDETRSGILSAAGKDDDGSILDAVNLNNLDDWTELHNTLS